MSYIRYSSFKIHFDSYIFKLTIILVFVVIAFTKKNTFLS